MMGAACTVGVFLDRYINEADILVLPMTYLMGDSLFSNLYIISYLLITVNRALAITFQLTTHHDHTDGGEAVPRSQSLGRGI